jgi:hypothetical protein
MRERDAALASRTAALRASEAAGAERAAAKAAAEAARRDRDSAVVDRAAARKKLDEAHRERDELRAGADIAPPAVRSLDQQATSAGWRTRLPAFGALAIILAVAAAFIYGLH